MKKLAFVVAFFMLFSGIVHPEALSNPVFADQFGLKAVGECGFVSLSWNNVKGADTYWIYRGPGKGKEYPTPLTDFPIRSTSFTDDINIKNGQEYCYFLTAVDSGAKEISKSAEACATPKCNDARQEPSCKLVLKYQIDNTSYWVNDDSKGPMETSPVIVNSRMFLVIRYVTSEIEGTNLEWAATEKKVKIKTRKGGIIELWIGKKDARIDGKTIQIDPNNPKVVPVIKDGRTLLPMRFVGENLGATGADGIKWFESTKTVEIRVDDPVCEKEGFRYPKAIQLKGALFEFSVEYHTSKGQFPEEVALGLTKSDNTKTLRLGKSKRGKVSSEDLSQIKTPEPRIEEIQSSFGKAKLYRFRLTLEPGVLHFYKFTSKIESLPNEGYLGPVSTPLPNATKIDDLDISRIPEDSSLTIQGYFTNEPYPMIVDDYWKIFERAGTPTKKMLVRLTKGQTLEDGTFVCLEGQTSKNKGILQLNVKNVVSAQKIVTPLNQFPQMRTSMGIPNRCPEKFALIFAGALDEAVVNDEEDMEHSYLRLRVDFVGEALNNYKTCFNLGICKQNIFVCFGRGDSEIDLICADDGDGNPLDFEWDDRANRQTMENDAQRWWRADDGWRVKQGTALAFSQSVDEIETKIDLLPNDVTPEVYILIGTHGNTDIIADSNGSVIRYDTIVDYIERFIENRAPSIHARSRIRILLDTCHAGSIVNNMENAFKSKGRDYLQLGASCSANELGYGIWPKDKTIPTYDEVGGSYGIPFRISLNTQAESNPDNNVDWGVAHDYAMLNDVYVLGREKERDDGSTYIVYTHPQFWRSREMSFYYAGPAFENPLTPQEEMRVNTCRIGVDTSDVNFDVCNCGVTLPMENYPKASFTIHNRGPIPLSIESIQADESVLSKSHSATAFNFSLRGNVACPQDSYFDFTLNYNESREVFICLIYHRLNAQPLDSNGYMATENGLPKFVQVPLRITYRYGSETFVQTAYIRLRVRGESYQGRCEVYAARSDNLKGKILNWESLDANMQITSSAVGLPDGVFAGPTTSGNVTMDIKTDIFKNLGKQGVSYNYLNSFKLEIVFDFLGDDCAQGQDWGWVASASIPSKLSDKLNVSYPSSTDRTKRKITIIITPGAHSKEGFGTIIGKHAFTFEIKKYANLDCGSANEYKTINLLINIEFINPT